ncbi:MAG: SDR family oxidoreductase [Bacillota bacterium]|nr:SDR family oxidoreductase [Bacillota bacterium]
MDKKITVITGGHGGMGKVIAGELGKETSLVLADMDENKLQQVKAALEETGYNVFTYVFDITDSAEVEALAEYAGSLGQVVNVINAAGVSPTDTHTDVILKVNALGTLNMVRAFYPIMAGGGAMINFGSVAAYTMEQDPAWTEVFEAWDEPDFYDRLLALLAPYEFDEFVKDGTAYVISKRFAMYFSQMNVMRFAKKGIRILSVSPGSYLTPMHQKLIDNQPDTAEDQLELVPCGRWGHPYEIAAFIAFLCSKGAGFIAGVDLLADAGQTANTFIEQIE